jgi:hypothetical protein
MQPDDVARNYRRWQAAEGGGRDDEADAEFAALFSASVPAPGVGPGFSARTMEAVAAAAAREATRWRRLRRATIGASVAAGVVALYFGAGVLATVLSTGVARAFNLLIALVVRIAGAAQTGADIWSVLASMGQAVGTFATNPTVTITLIALQGIAVAALFALQRLLGVDGIDEELK